MKDKVVIPQLSIIVPVYNVKQYIDKCIESILCQSYKNFELILVDDGSTDGSEILCDKWNKIDTRIRVFHKNNGGLSDARNVGIKHSYGEYIGFCDSDDCIEPDMFQELMSTAINNDADVSICRVKCVNLQGEIIDILGYNEFKVMNRRIATMEILRDEIMKSFAWNKIYKRKLFNGIEYPFNRIFEDTATTYKLISCANKVAVTPYIGYNYLMNPNSLCNNVSIDFSKRVKREYDNALAFGERYIFCKNDNSLTDVRTICANKAYMRMRAFLHLQAHKRFELTDKQKAEISNIMNSFSLCDLKNFTLVQKLDVMLYRYCRPLLYIYLRLISIIHPMSRDL